MAGSASALSNFWLLAQTALDGPAARTFAQAGNIILPNKLPGIAEAFEAYRQGWITEGRLERLLVINGAKWDPNNLRTGAFFKVLEGGVIGGADNWMMTEDPWIAELWGSWERWDLSTIRELLNRGMITQKLAHLIMQTHGWESGTERQVLFDLRHPIPAPVQLLDMAIRGALDPANYGPGGLSAEYDGRYDRWAKATGLDQITLPGSDAAGPPTTINFPAALWALHWTLPTLSQWFEMRRRLRPSVANPQVSADPSGIVVDPALETMVYQSNGIHPSWRDAMRAISYKPISLRHIDILYEFGQIGRPGVQDLLQSTGLAPENAKKLAAARTDRVDRTRRKDVIRQARLQIEAAWELGSINDADFIAGLQSVGLRPEEVQEALRLAGVEHTRKRLDRSIKAIRQQALTGQMAMADARATLLTIGLQGTRVDEYISDWTLDLSGRRKLLSAGYNLKAAADGLLSLDDLVARLRNLNYYDADISLFLGELQITLAGRLAKAAAAAEHAAEKSRRQAERVARQLQQAAAQARAALARHGTPEKLKKWFCEGTITETEVRDRLHFLLWPDADIDRLLAECLDKALPPRTVLPTAPEQPPQGGP